MGLAGLTKAFADHLSATVSPAPKLVGSAYPTDGTQLPAVVLSVTEVKSALQGVGRLPAPSETGALPVTTVLDLAHPVATFPDATVPLVSDGGLTLALPHGPLVAADGQTTTFGAADLVVTVRNGSPPTTFAVVAGAPAAGQVRPDPDLGTLRFGAALPGIGTLTARYFVGEWEVRTERYQGALRVETFAADAAGVEALAEDVEAALLAPARPMPGLNRIEPTSWGAIEEAGVNHAQARGGALGFAFDYELVEPLIGGGGGLISTVHVKSTVPALPPQEVEEFDVHREGSTP